MRYRILNERSLTNATALLVLYTAIATACADDHATAPADPADDTAVGSLEVVPPEVTFTSLGDTLRFSAQVKAKNGQPLRNVQVEWSIRDSAIAALGSDGLVIARGEGQTELVATAAEMTGTAEIHVAVPDTLIIDVAAGDSTTVQLVSGTRIIVPPGALSADGTLIATEQVDRPAAPDSLLPYGQPLDITLDGTHLVGQLILEYPYRIADLHRDTLALEDISLFHWSGTTWEPLDTEPDIEAGVLRAPVAHLSVFAAWRHLFFNQTRRGDGYVIKWRRTRFLERLGIGRGHTPLPDSEYEARTAGRGEGIPGYIRDVEAALVSALRRYGQMGYRIPETVEVFIFDGDYPSEIREEIFDFLRRELDVRCLPEAKSNFVDNLCGTTAWIDNDMAGLKQYLIGKHFALPDLLRVVVAHEAFHVVQFEYGRPGRWLMESTARWMENELFDDLDDGKGNEFAWYSLLNESGEFIANLESSLPTTDRRLQYARFPFFQHLSKLYGSDIVRELWESVDGADDDDIKVLERVLAGKGTSLEKLWTEFAENYLYVHDSAYGEFKEWDRFLAGDGIGGAPGPEFSPYHLVGTYGVSEITEQRPTAGTRWVLPSLSAKAEVLLATGIEGNLDVSMRSAGNRGLRVVAFPVRSLWEVPETRLTMAGEGKRKIESFGEEVGAVILLGINAGRTEGTIGIEGEVTYPPEIGDQEPLQLARLNQCSLPDSLGATPLGSSYLYEFGYRDTDGDVIHGGSVVVVEWEFFFEDGSAANRGSFSLDRQRLHVEGDGYSGRMQVGACYRWGGTVTLEQKLHVVDGAGNHSNVLREVIRRPRGANLVSPSPSGAGGIVIPGEG